MLFTSDAQPDVLMPVLERFVGPGEPLEVDVFQVPHHGSKHNVSTELIKRIRSPRYLFSSNGSVYGHPDKEAVARVLAHGQEEPKTLYFNYKQPHNEIWKDDRLTNRYGYAACYPTEDGVVVDT